MALSTISGTTGITDATITSAKLADFSAAVDLNGVELILDADQDTSITADTDDRIDFKIANVEHFSFSNSSGDTIVKPMVDAKDIKFQQFDGRTLLDINDAGFVGIENGATGPGAIRIFEDSDLGSNYVGLSVGNVSTAYTLVFPNADGSSGQALTTNGSGVLSFTTMSANTPSSADGQALGSASLEWSDLFLADSGTIQFGNDQDTILTHTDGAGLTLNSTNKLMFNDASQFIQGASATVLDIAATDEIELTATLIEVVGNATVSGTLGVTGVTTSNAGVVVDNITIDGTEIDLSSGDLTIDVAGDIILDADGGDFKFQDGGTEVLRISNSSSDVVIKPTVDTKDIIFQQFDGTEVARIEDNATFNVSSAGKFAYAGTAVTSTAAELNILDGVTSTAAELNIVDGDTSATGTTIADADRIVLNDNGTMVQAAVTDLKTYIGATGKIGQVVQTVKTDVFSTTSSSLVDVTGLSRAITPSASSSKILVMVEVSGLSTDNSVVQLQRGSTIIGAGAAASSRTRSFGGSFYNGSVAAPGLAHYSISFIDEPNTTSAVTYKIVAGAVGGGTLYLGRNTTDNNDAQHTRVPQLITCMEILA